MTPAERKANIEHLHRLGHCEATAECAAICDLMYEVGRRLHQFCRDHKGACGCPFCVHARRNEGEFPNINDTMLAAAGTILTLQQAIDGERPLMASEWPQLVDEPEPLVVEAKS